MEITCYCDQWMKRLSGRVMRVEFKCPVHGDVALDNRHVSHVHPPAYIPSPKIEPRKTRFPVRC